MDSSFWAMAGIEWVWFGWTRRIGRIWRIERIGRMGRMGRIGQIGRMGLIGVRERLCERRCGDWWGEGRVWSLAVPVWCRGVESLNGAGQGGWLRESGSGLPVFGALGWLVRRGGLYGVLCHFAGYRGVPRVVRGAPWLSLRRVLTCRPSACEIPFEAVKFVCLKSSWCVGCGREESRESQDGAFC